MENLLFGISTLQNILREILYYLLIMQTHTSYFISLSYGFATFNMRMKNPPHRVTATKYILAKCLVLLLLLGEHSGQEYRIWSQTAWTQIPSLLCIVFMTLDKLCKCSGPQFPHVLNGFGEGNQTENVLNAVSRGLSYAKCSIAESNTIIAPNIQGEPQSQRVKMQVLESACWK